MSIYAEALHLSAVGEADRVLDLVEGGLRRFGASHLLLTGLPLPRRSATKLILRIIWPDRRSGGHVIDIASEDPLIGHCYGARRPFVVAGGHLRAPDWGEAAADRFAGSELLAAGGGDDSELVVVPIHDLRPYQGCVIVAGSDLVTTHEALASLEHFCLTGFHALARAGRLDLARPGDLSERERHVLQLTSAGKTAAEIAELLTISQRTVHAHLQNASDKMCAANKTQTVVEALRFGQIVL